MIYFKHRGKFSMTEKFFNRITGKQYLNNLSSYGGEGASALASATPVESGKTASSWDYEIQESSTGPVISWLNTNVNKGVNIAVILDSGHGTGTGGYVPPKKFIRPAIDPVMTQITENVWKEVAKK